MALWLCLPYIVLLPFHILIKNKIKTISKRIQKYIEDNSYLYYSEETTNIPEEDRYDSYSEDCYLGCRISTELEEDKMFYQMKGYFIFAKVIPSWITLEK